MHTDKRENIGHLLEDYLKSSLSTYKEAYQLLFKNPYVKDFLSKHFTCNFLEQTTMPISERNNTTISIGLSFLKYRYFF